MDSPAEVSLAIGLTAALALLSYYLIEQPVRRMKMLPYQRVFAIALAGILIVGTSSAAMARTSLGSNLYLYKAYDKGDWRATLEETKIEGSQISRGNCNVGQDSFSPPVLEEQYELCTYPSKYPDNPRIFLIGDSHAESTLPMLGEVVKETDVGLTSIFSPACFGQYGYDISRCNV